MAAMQELVDGLTSASNDVLKSLKGIPRDPRKLDIILHTLEQVAAATGSLREESATAIEAFGLGPPVQPGKLLTALRLIAFQVKDYQGTSMNARYFTEPAFDEDGSLASTYILDSMRTILLNVLLMRQMFGADQRADRRLWDLIEWETPPRQTQDDTVWTIPDHIDDDDSVASDESSEDFDSSDESGDFDSSDDSGDFFDARDIAAEEQEAVVNKDQVMSTMQTLAKGGENISGVWFDALRKCVLSLNAQQIKAFHEFVMKQTSDLGRRHVKLTKIFAGDLDLWVKFCGRSESMDPFNGVWAAAQLQKQDRLMVNIKNVAQVFEAFSKTLVELSKEFLSQIPDEVQDTQQIASAVRQIMYRRQIVGRSKIANLIASTTPEGLMLLQNITKARRELRAVFRIASAVSKQAAVEHILKAIIRLAEGETPVETVLAKFEEIVQVIGISRSNDKDDALQATSNPPSDMANEPTLDGVSLIAEHEQSVSPEGLEHLTRTLGLRARHKSRLPVGDSLDSHSFLQPRDMSFGGAQQDSTGIGQFSELESRRNAQRSPVLPTFVEHDEEDENSEGSGLNQSSTSLHAQPKMDSDDAIAASMAMGASGDGDGNGPSGGSGFLSDDIGDKFQFGNDGEMCYITLHNAKSGVHYLVLAGNSAADAHFIVNFTVGKHTEQLFKNMFEHVLRAKINVYGKRIDWGTSSQTHVNNYQWNCFFEDHGGHQPVASRGFLFVPLDGPFIQQLLRSNKYTSYFKRLLVDKNRELFEYLYFKRRALPTPKITGGRPLFLPSSHIGKRGAVASSVASSASSVGSKVASQAGSAAPLVSVAATAAPAQPSQRSLSDRIAEFGFTDLTKSRKKAGSRRRQSSKNGRRRQKMKGKARKPVKARGGNLGAAKPSTAAGL
jgi:hypothetical protein